LGFATLTPKRQPVISVDTKELAGNFKNGGRPEDLEVFCGLNGGIQGESGKGRIDARFRHHLPIPDADHSIPGMAK
jgi:hypothetical protein